MGVTVIVCPATVDIQTVLSRCRKKAPGLEVRVEKARDEAELESRLRALAGSERNTFTVNTKGGVRIVQADSIMLCRAEGHRFRLWLNDGSQLLSCTTRVPFSKNVAPLLEMDRFLRTGATVLVSLDAIEVIRDGHIWMTNGMKLSFSARWQALAERTLRYGRLGKSVKMGAEPSEV